MIIIIILTTNMTMTTELELQIIVTKVIHIPTGSTSKEKLKPVLQSLQYLIFCRKLQKMIKTFRKVQVDRGRVENSTDLLKEEKRRLTC